MKTTFLSYGGGVQTFALVVLAERGKVLFDEVVFADTGAEHKETYNHIDKIVRPLLERLNIPFTVVRMTKVAYEYKTGEKKTTHSLEEMIECRRRIPSIRMRWCTEYSKITPIRHYIRKQQEAGEYVKPADAVIGISWDERLRMHKPHLSEYVNKYPLVEMQLTRNDCKKIIIDNGYPLPPKSGCYFCPFQSEREWRNLYFNEPDKYEKAMKMEERDSKFPTYRLFANGKTLRDLKISFGDRSYTLEEFDGREAMTCEQAGYCKI